MGVFFSDGINFLGIFLNVGLQEFEIELCGSKSFRVEEVDVECKFHHEIEGDEHANESEDSLDELEQAIDDPIS